MEAERPDERKKEERRGPVARFAPIVSLVGAIVGVVTGVLALWPEDDPPAVGDITRLELAGTSAFSETEFPDTGRCPGIEKRPRFKVGLPVAAASVPLAQETEEAPPPPTEPAPESSPAVPPDEAREPPPSGRPALRVDPEALRDLGRAAELEPREVPGRLFSNRPDERPPTLAETDGMLARTVQARRGSKPDPLGWLVDIDTLLEHLDGKCAYVHWTLYEERSNRRVNRAWLVDRRGVRFVARGTPDRRSAVLWVPIPIERRRYVLRAALYDAEATRLDVARAKGLER